MTKPDHAAALADIQRGAGLTINLVACYLDLTRQLTEWQNGERQYPPAVEDHRELLQALNKLKFDYAELRKAARDSLDETSLALHYPEAKINADTALRKLLGGV